MSGDWTIRSSAVDPEYLDIIYAIPSEGKIQVDCKHFFTLAHKRFSEEVKYYDMTGSRPFGSIGYFKEDRKIVFRDIKVPLASRSSVGSIKNQLLPACRLICFSLWEKEGHKFQTKVAIFLASLVFSKRPEELLITVESEPVSHGLFNAELDKLGVLIHCLQSIEITPEPAVVPEPFCIDLARSDLTSVLFAKVLRGESVGPIGEAMGQAIQQKLEEHYCPLDFEM